MRLRGRGSRTLENRGDPVIRLDNETRSSLHGGNEARTRSLAAARPRFENRGYPCTWFENRGYPVIDSNRLH